MSILDICHGLSLRMLMKRPYRSVILPALACLLAAASAAAETAPSQPFAAPPAKLAGPPATAPVPPAPRPAVQRQQPQTAAFTKITPEAAQHGRLTRLNAVTSWGYQLSSLAVEPAAASPFGLLVVDATGGLVEGRPFTREQVERLKRAPDGSRRIVISYLSIGESEDYRSDYFSKEYMEEEAPDSLLKENPNWKGNRLIRFCEEGWQKTILGDEQGRNVYSGDAPSPLYKLLELGFDGVYLDRVDAYAEITKECPNSAAKMVDFVVRLAAHARKKEPGFMVILQNAEELVADARLLEVIDGIAKESLFTGGDMSQKKNSKADVDAAVSYLNMAKAAGRAVFVVDYVTNKVRASEDTRRISAAGFVPYIGPRDLGALWLPGVNF